ncbi:hypothetical protein EFZ10_08400 [Tatumella sp. TA1]|nr:hypothetical protein EFZ10_08400 [Tatumella sp. TA1]
MADYKIPTPTQKPVPSPDIRDVVFAGAKVDEWAASEAHTYIDRFGKQHLTSEGIEYNSKEQLSSQEDRFQQFLLNSGYVILPDYIDGPITFTARNQVTAYGGEYYRPKAGIVLPFTTSGINDASFQSDKGNFISVGDATVRFDLASKQGAGLIGGCLNMDEVRSVEPSYHGQKIKVITAVSGGPIVNAYVRADLSDTTTADNGYSVFVTPGGKRWKVKVDNGIDIRFAGLNSSLTNLGSVCQKIIDGEVAKINAQTSFKNVISCLKIPSNLGEYTLDVGVVMPTMMQLDWVGNLFVNYPLSTGTAIWLKNTGLNFSDGGMASNRWFSDIQGSRALSPSGGRLYLSGTQSNVSASTNESLYPDTASVRVGELGTDKFSARDLVVGNVTPRWFGKALQIDNTNNYCNQYEHFVVSGCDWGVYFTDADQANGKGYTNSGEHVNFNKMVIGDTRLGHLYMSAYGYYYMNDCHLDYTKGDVVYFPKQGTGIHLVINNPHVEGFDGYLVNSPIYTQYGSWHLDSSVVFNNPTLTINRATGTSLPFRKLVNISDGQTRVTINEAVWALSTGNYNKHNLPYVALAGWDLLPPELFTINASSSLRPTSWMYRGCVRMLPSYNAGLLGRNRWYFNNANSIFGRQLTLGSKSSSDANTLVYFDASDTSKFTVTYDSALDADGHMSLIINSTDASATLYMILPEFVDGKILKQWQGGVSVAGTSVSSGVINMYMQAIAYGAETVTGSVNGSVVTLNSTRPLRFSHNGNTVSVTDFINGAGLSNTQFVGVFSGLAQYFEGDVVQLRQAFTGFVGAIRIKCPVWWFNNLN